MPIPVACACGARFAAQDQLAGRTVKCPKCQAPLAIPAGAPAAPAMASPAQFPGAPPAQFPGAPPAMAGPGSGSDLFSQAGLHAAPVGTMPCPGCTAPLQPGVVVCIQCGYNVKLGRRMGTVNLDRQAGGAHSGHGDAVAAMLNKAEAAIDEDREYEASKGKEGMPWWGYLLILMGLIGFSVLMMALPTSVAMRSAGITILVGCGALNLYLGIRLIMIAFEENVTQGILYVLVPFYPLFYIFTRWDKCGGLFMRALMVEAFSLLGWLMLFIANLPPSTGTE